MGRLNFTVMAADNRGVDQVSRPMQIALCAVVLFVGMWFTVLRPKANDGGSAPTPAAAPAAPGTAGLGKAVAKANGAVSASEASAKATETAAAKAGGEAATASTPGSTAAAKAGSTKAATGDAAKAAPSGDPSAALLANLAHGKTIVLLFSGKGADDRAAAKAVRRVAAHDKAIVTRVAPITQVGDYEQITTGVQVLTAPTVVVIGKNRKAVSVSGYTEPGVLRQLVGDARRAAAAK
jgi:hypothetical protein